jgi:hypothetical protein
VCFDFTYKFVWNMSFAEEICKILSSMYIGLHVKYHPLFLSDFHETWTFLIDFFKKLEQQISRISFQWEPICSIRINTLTETDRHTGRHYKLTAAFHNFANAPKKDIKYKSPLWIYGQQLPALNHLRRLGNRILLASGENMHTHTLLPKRKMSAV